MILRNIIIINDSAAINGGQAKVAISSAIGLAGAGLSVTYFAGQGPADPSLAAAGIRVVCLDQHDILSDPSRLRAMARGIWNLEAARRLKQLLDEFSPDDTIVHCHGFAKVLSGAIGPVITGNAIPHIFTMHEYFLACPNGGFFHYPDNAICTRKALGPACLTTNCDPRRASHKAWRVARQIAVNTVGNLPRGLKNVIYISEVVRETMQPYLQPDTRSFYVHNPVDVYETRPANVAGNEAFLFVGRLSPEKGATIFAQAARELGVRAVFIGHGEDSARVAAIYPDATQTGWLKPSEVLCWIQKSRCLVFPSVWKETLGLVALEALAYGVPVITGRWNGAADAVEHGGNGLLLDEVTPRALADAMKQMDAATASRMGGQAHRQYWSAPPTVASHIAALIRTYDEVMGS